jgi:hypothetical protein
LDRQVNLRNKKVIAHDASASREIEIASTSRYVLPNDLDAAIMYLDDQQLDKLVSEHSKNGGDEEGHLRLIKVRGASEPDPEAVLWPACRP